MNFDNQLNNFNLIVYRKQNTYTINLIYQASKRVDCIFFSSFDSIVFYSRDKRSDEHKRET